MTTLNLPSLWDDGHVDPLESRPVVIDDLPTSRDIPTGQVFVIRNHESRYLTHTFHKYAGKFIPQVPRWAMRRYLQRDSGALVLDPFVGSGTTLVECMLEGHRGVGIDIDPLARLIAKVKTTLIPARRLSTLAHEVEKRLARRRSGDRHPSIPTLSHWFTARAVRDLSAIKTLVEAYEEEPDVHDFLLISFSSIIRRASNADNQTMKTYVSHTHHKTPEPARELFVATVRDYADRLIKLGELVASRGSASVLDSGDARALTDLKALSKKGVELAITSPPYIKSVDYIYNQMAELFWIGERWGLETQPKQNDFKKRYVGADRISASEVALVPDTAIPSVDRYIELVRNNDPALAAVMARYFNDMLKHFREMKKLLNRGAHYILVIGDSTLAGVAVPTHKLLIACAEAAGFSAQVAFAYEIRNKHMRFPRGGRGGEVYHDRVIDISLP